MSARLAFPVAWLLMCAVLLQLAAGSGTGTTFALVASAMVCGLIAFLADGQLGQLRGVKITTPADRRLHGRFLQQSRPGVPGRTRARAPGCGH